MEQQINNYKNVMALSDSYLDSQAGSRFVQELMSIERLLDRSRVYISELASNDEEKEKSRLFVQEVNQYLDTVIRPKTFEKIQKLSSEEKGELLNNLDFTHHTSRKMIED